MFLDLGSIAIRRITTALTDIDLVYELTCSVTNNNANIVVVDTNNSNTASLGVAAVNLTVNPLADMTIAFWCRWNFTYLGKYYDSVSDSTLINCKDNTCTIQLVYM